MRILWGCSAMIVLALCGASIAAAGQINHDDYSTKWSSSQCREPTEPRLVIVNKRDLAIAEEQAKIYLKQVELYMLCVRDEMRKDLLSAAERLKKEADHISRCMENDVDAFMNRLESDAAFANNRMR